MPYGNGFGDPVEANDFQTGVRTAYPPHQLASGASPTETYNAEIVLTRTGPFSGYLLQSGAVIVDIGLQCLFGSGKKDRQEFIHYLGGVYGTVYNGASPKIHARDRDGLASSGDWGVRRVIGSPDVSQENPIRVVLSADGYPGSVQGDPDGQLGLHTFVVTITSDTVDTYSNPGGFLRPIFAPTLTLTVYINLTVSETAPAPPPGGGGTEDTDTMDGKERISFDSGRDGRRFRAYVGASDALNVEAPSTFNGASTSWVDNPTARTGRFPCVRLSSATGALELAYITPASATVGAGALVRTRSLDNALTWSADVQIASSGATFPAIVTARDGRRLFYWIAGGALYGQIVGGTGGVIEPTFTAIAGTGIKAVDVAERVDTGGVWRVEAAVRFTDGSLVFYRSDPAGKVFAAV